MTNDELFCETLSKYSISDGAIRTVCRIFIVVNFYVYSYLRVQTAKITQERILVL